MAAIQVVRSPLWGM